jgi:hypothetical protein
MVTLNDSLLCEQKGEGTPEHEVQKVRSGQCPFKLRQGEKVLWLMDSNTSSKSIPIVGQSTTAFSFSYFNGL